MAFVNSECAEFDFIIIGSGAASVAASLVMKQSGRSALIIEKQEKFGGSTGYSGGILWVPNNPLMQREGVPDSFEAAQEYLNSTLFYTGPGSSHPRREAFLRGAPRAIDFLEQKGMKFNRVEGYADYYDERPGGHQRGRTLTAKLFDLSELGEWQSRLSVNRGVSVPAGLDELNDLFSLKTTWAGKKAALKVGARLIYQKLLGRDIRGAGAALQGRLLQIALRENLQIWMASEVEGFIVENDCVTGVTILRGTQRIKVKASLGVLINAGGFAHNAEMRAKYDQPASNMWTSANPGDTGEVMTAAMALGAASDCLDESWWLATSIGPDGSFPEGAYDAFGKPVPFLHHFDISYPHVIMVDQDGNRFVNEASSYMEIGQRMFAQHKEKGNCVPAWAIIESRHRNRYFWATVLGKTPQSWLDSGYMKKADTIKELAELCGINPQGLQESVERFNGFAKAGVDQDFGKGARAFDRYHGDPSVRPNPNLGEIIKPPFYAVAIVPGDLGTCGGLVTDEHGRVLRTEGGIIPGLYATGNSTASVMGRSYPGAGATIAPSLTFGFLAAEHAVRTNDKS